MIHSLVYKIGLLNGNRMLMSNVTHIIGPHNQFKHISGCAEKVYYGVYFRKLIGVILLIGGYTLKSKAFSK